MFTSYTSSTIQNSLVIIRNRNARNAGWRRSPLSISIELIPNDFQHWHAALSLLGVATTEDS